MLTGLLRKIVLKGTPFRFVNQKIDFACVPEEVGLYIHIPFCESLCPFCPYTKELYVSGVGGRYRDAVLHELALLKRHIQGRKVTSVYFGGGTPTLLINEVIEVMAWLRLELDFRGNAGIELHPREAAPGKLEKMKDAGINMVSVGVQTFQDSLLQNLGRSHTGAEAKTALSLVMDVGFACVDADIMFNLPNQTAEGIRQDIIACYEMGVDQLSVYPLIRFAMTPLPLTAKQQRFHFFSNLQEYRLLKQIKNVSSQYGYLRTSVWTYGKPGAPRYTSVTRENFIGVGAGAASQFGQYFYLNTFSVRAYMDRLEQGLLPVNLVHTMSRRERMVYWLFWRCYELAINLDRFKALFKADIAEEFPLLIGLARCTCLAKRKDRNLNLTGIGAYLYHLLEKHYSKTYLNDTWAACQASPWLDEFSLD